MISIFGNREADPHLIDTRNRPPKPRPTSSRATLTVLRHFTLLDERQAADPRPVMNYGASKSVLA